LTAAGIEKRAYTNFEFLDALCLDIDVYKSYIEWKTPKTREFTG
jgi:hypothetical protein